MPDTADTGKNGAEERASLGFGDLYASPGDHIGHFYQTTEEWKEILIPFLANGVQAGEKCVYFMEPGSRWEDLQEGLADAGGDVEETHPTCVISSIIHQNPYYEDPESFLEELRARESTPLA